MAKGPKQKGKLAKALSGQQAAQALRQQQERTAQGEKDRMAAVKAKMASGAKGGAANKRRKLGGEGGGKGKERAAGEDADEAETVAEVEERKRKGMQPFRKGERVLLVGEGNFSFAHSLLLPLSTASAASTSSAPPAPLVNPSLLLCTAYDSLAVCTQKYPDLDTHVSALRAAGATVLFGVDATKLEENKEVREFARLGKVRSRKGRKGSEMPGAEEGAGGFDKIVFNFPHVGQGITDQARNIRTNQILLLDFYSSASLLLRRGTPRAPGTSSSSATTNARRETSRSPSPTPPPADDEALDEDGDGSDALDPAASFLPPPSTTRGSILLTLRTTAPYTHWLPSQLATKGHLLTPSLLSLPEYRARLAASNGAEQPRYKVVRSWGFDPGDWEGYEHRRTLGYEEGRSSGANEDLELTARERKARKMGLGGGEGGAEGAAKGADGGKGKNDPLMRTWEFECVYPEEWLRGEERAGGGGKGGKTGAGGGKRKRGGGDPDLSDS
ncbi:hypothetical protein JCM6882_000863 [Rhodosporidiobolus microsporus]